MPEILWKRRTLAPKKQGALFFTENFPRASGGFICLDANGGPVSILPVQADGPHF